MSEEIKVNQEQEHSCDVEEVTKKLGISKTRLSQLTSQGHFSTVRRNVAGRSRVFYHKVEIEDYLRNKQKNAIENLEKLQISTPLKKNEAEAPIEQHPTTPSDPTPVRFSRQRQPPTSPQAFSSLHTQLKKAADLRRQKRRDAEILRLHAEIHELKKALMLQNQQIESLIKSVKHQSLSSRLKNKPQQSSQQRSVFVNQKEINLNYSLKPAPKKEAQIEKRWKRSQK